MEQSRIRRRSSLSRERGKQRSSRPSTTSSLISVEGEEDGGNKTPLTVAETMLRHHASSKRLVNVKPFAECSFEEQICHPLLEHRARSRQKVLYLIKCINQLRDNDLTFVIFHASNAYLPGHWVRNLAQTLGKNSILRRIHLNGNNGINDADLDILAGALEANHTVVELAVGGTSLTDLGAEVLARMLLQNTTLQSLNLAGPRKVVNGRQEPPISPRGAAALAQALQKNKTLTSLVLADHTILCLGATSLGRALESSTTLKHLVVSNNDIADHGAIALALTLTNRKEGLISLDLSGNAIGDEGAKQLASALQQNSCLTTLDLSRNRMGDAGINHFLQLVMLHNHVLRAVVLFDNPVDEGKIRMIQDILSKRHPTDIRRYSTFPVRSHLLPYKDSDTNLLHLRGYPHDEPIKYHFPPKGDPRKYNTLPTPDKHRNEQPISFATRENYKMRMRQEREGIGRTLYSREWKETKLGRKGQIAKREWFPVHDIWAEFKSRLPLKYRQGIDQPTPYEPPKTSPILSYVEYRAMTPLKVAREGWLTAKQQKALPNLARIKSPKTINQFEGSIPLTDDYSVAVANIFGGGRSRGPPRRRLTGMA